MKYRNSFYNVAGLGAEDYRPPYYAPVVGMNGDGGVSTGVWEADRDPGGDGEGEPRCQSTYTTTNHTPWLITYRGLY